MSNGDTSVVWRDMAGLAFSKAKVLGPLNVPLVLGGVAGREAHPCGTSAGGFQQVPGPLHWCHARQASDCSVDLTGPESEDQTGAGLQKCAGCWAL